MFKDKIDEYIEAIKANIITTKKPIFSKETNQGINEGLWVAIETLEELKAKEILVEKPQHLKMSKKKIKMKEPPLGSVIIDRCGSAWERTPVGWLMVGSDNSWSYPFDVIINADERSEYHRYPEHFLDRPKIVYVPNEELIEDLEEDED